ncbi:hypothetical protein AB0P41_15885 [Streptomyces sp. NPDC079167]|uniref:hypothetical protein n=1 Tax=Streptomyces sp. NPDC079167 TaxID=3154513 RepID=UPI00342B7389
MTEQTVTPAEPERTAAQPEPTEAPASPEAAAPVLPPPPTAPPMPQQPAGAGPGGPGGPEPVKPPRRVLRAVARWTAVVLVLGSLGTGTAFGIASMERTDVPGLATEHDGRWEYPALTLPALPSGSPRPFSPGNTAQIHHADLRDLLIPAPAGAAVDSKIDGGWTTPEQFASEYRKDGRDRIRGLLADSALRHIAARGWSMPDGTTSRVYLLRFNSTAYAEGFRDDMYIGGGPGQALDWKEDLVFDEGWEGSDKDPDTTTFVFTDAQPDGKERIRAAYVQAGDTVALIVHERKGSKPVPEVPFHQTLILQDQLLG